MAKSCPHLEYHKSKGEKQFETARGYCTIAKAFVQPMRADICTHRYGLHHERDCEIYQAHVDDEETVHESDGGNS